ncbi:hypothetical protein EMPS_10010 [Entomortierella parvispora]|uniref:Uncharacterized protein n=1 Tax=Entomortierella parvispora TaxID=205924 RepID=A0A9P3M0K9_9FUNG|nr:hypothetical protein EMPS_10010 [Entomortierella parvispora]
MNEPTSTVVATFASALVSATAAIASPYPINTATEPPYTHNTSDTTFPSPTPPTSPNGYGPGMNPALMSPLLCDWIRSAANCRDADFIRVLLIASSALHGFVFLFGLWLLIYRNRGLNGKIVSELFIKVGTGVRPKPMDCIIFFTAIASLIKVGVNAPLIFNVWVDKLWLRIAIEQTYWIFVAIGFSSYFVGLLYAMPVTTREGVFAVYQPETTFDARPLPPIHVLTPTTVQKNFLLIMGALYPAIFGAGAGVASAVFAQMEGQERLARILLLVQYSNWVLILWSMAIMFFYYGLKYTFILRANIIIAEAALKAPKAAFGISNLRSASPARFLFIQLQITGFGGSAVTVLAGTLCLLWVVFRDQILAMQQEQLPHTMAFFWTCAMAAAFFVIMALIAVQSVRNRRRGLHDPSSSFTASALKSSSGQGHSAIKSLYSSQNHHKNSNSSSSSEQHLRSVTDSMEFSSQESYNHSSFDIPDKDSVQALVMATQRIDYDAFAVSHQINKMEIEKPQRDDLLTSPKKPLTMKAHSPQALPPSPSPLSSTFTAGRRGDRTSESGSTGHASILSTGSSTIRPQHQDLRHTVFGSSRSTPRPSSPPPTPSPSTSSFPLTSLRSSPRPNPSPAEDQDARLSYLPYTPPITTSSTPVIPERKKSRLHSDHHPGSPSLGSHFPVDRLPRPDRSAERQSPSVSSNPSNSLQYHVSCKGLSPPPRAKRLPTPANNFNFSNSPEIGDSLPATLPPPQFPTSEPGRNTFMAAPKQAQFSATPRIGGGTRRKSIKETDEQGEREPAWPLPPASS